MEHKSYRYLWWILAFILLAGIISYIVLRNPQKEYTDGTLVWQQQQENHLVRRADTSGVKAA
jgi:hypothetical protein